MKKILKVIISSAFVCMLTVLTLSGCGSKPAETPKPSANTPAPANTSTAKQVTLDFIWFSDGVEGQVMKNISAQYEKDHPNVKINLIEVPFKDLNTKIKTMISGGKPPALARITDTGNFFSNAIDLSPYVGDVEKFTSQFLDSHKGWYIKDGKPLGVPLDITANGMIYNKTLFKKAGIEAPLSPDKVWTWDEFITNIKTIMQKSGTKYGMVWDVTPHRFSTMLYQFGGSLFSEDRSKMVLNNEKGVAALEFFVKMHKDGIMPESVWLGGENPNNLFRSGQIPVHMSGNWMLSNYRDIKDFEWGVMYMPKKETRSTIPGGKYLMGFKGTGVEKETAEFIKYLSSKEASTQYCKESLFISPRKDCQDIDYPFAKDAFKVFSEELKASTPLAPNDWSYQEIIPKVSTDYKNSIMEAIQGKVTAKQVLDKVVKIGDEAIKEFKSK